MRSGATPAFVLARVCAPAAQAWLPVSDSDRGCEPRQGGDCGRSALGVEVWRLVDPIAESAQERLWPCARFGLPRLC